MLRELVTLRADVAELGADVRRGQVRRLGGLPELKAGEARMDDLLTRVQASGAQLRSLAPLLLDLSGQLDGVPVQLCWLEGEPELAWYHRADLGVAGRRPLR